MNENLNLVEILKDCPKGTKLWSPLYGELSLFRILKGREYPIRLTDKNDKFVEFMSNGFEDDCNVECLIFPDKNQRDWSKFKVKKPKFDPKTLKPFDKVLVRYLHTEWTCAFLSHIKYVDGKSRFRTINNSYEYCIPYNDNTKHLVGTTEKAPEYYRYWED